jgi:tetratricopeptide (TPR) repeat protein
MKKMLVSIVLGLVGVAGQAAAQQPQATPPAQPQAQPAQPQGQTGAAQNKTIKDPAEYNAYVGAVQQADPAAKISGLEAFLTQYPNSVMKADALETLMAAYQQTGNAAKMADAANRLLAVDPNNVKALALMAYTDKANQKWQDAQQHSIAGLQAIDKMTKPDGVSDAEFQKQKTQLSALLNSIAGFSSLQLKDNANAQKYLRAAVEANPNSLEDVYPLAVSYLTSTPENDVDGLFFIARAASLAQDPKGKDQITKFGHSKYVKYHGSEEGWNELLAQAASTPMPPPGFTIKQYIPPTPAEQAADLVKSKDPKDMSFAEWELVLSVGKPEDADKVWTFLKGKSLQFAQALVLKAEPNKLELAASQDDIDAKRADVMLEMTAAIPARLMPKEGSTIDFEGTPVSYEPNPFVMTMNKGALLTKAAPATHKPPVHHKPSAQ